MRELFKGLLITRGDQVVSEAKKESSAKVSSLAAKYVNLSYDELLDMLENWSDEEFESFVADIRSLAASVLSQDETKGS